MKVNVFIFLLASVCMFSGCMIDDGDPQHHLDVSSTVPGFEYFGEKGTAIKTWEYNNTTLYHAQYSDGSGLFQFNCVATVENPKLISGFGLTNSQNSTTSAITAKGIRSSSYIMCRYNSDIQTDTPVGIFFKEEGDPSKAKAYKVAGLYVTNSRGAYSAMQKGVSNIKKFESGDWYKLTIYNKDKSRKIECMLGDGTNMVTKWKFLKLTSLGHTEGLLFELSSSLGDINQLELLSYFCIDGIILE